MKPGRISQPRLSPDGRRVAVRQFENGWHIWWYDVDRATGTRVTDDGTNRDPVWSADGEWIYYASDRNGELDIWRRRADLGAPAELVYGPSGNQVPVGVTPDGRWVVFLTLDPNGSAVARVDPARPDSAEVLVDRSVDAPAASLSPDGRLLAYASFNGGAWQVRVLDIATRRQLTADSGYQPEWSMDGRALLYEDSGALKVMDVMAGAVFQAGAVRSVSGRTFAIDCCSLMRRDRIIVAELIRPDAVDWISVIVNWPAAAKARR